MVARNTQQKTKSVSYRAKDVSSCPVCGQEFQREMLHSGGGRLIAGKLTEELRRLYELNKKFGKVYPQAYTIQVCPSCLFSSFPNDFNTLDPSEVAQMKQKSMERRNGIEKLVGPTNFGEDRNLVLGAASYILAIECYQLRGMNIAPTPKKAVCAMRGAWLFDEMFKEFPDIPYNQIRDHLYLKAVQYYLPTLDIMSTGREPHDQFINLLGPDTDNNWGFDGVIYLNAHLTTKFIKKISSDPAKQYDLLEKSRRHLGKLYGMGKASKSKPSVLIDMSKDLYDKMTQVMEEQYTSQHSPEGAEAGTE